MLCRRAATQRTIHMPPCDTPRPAHPTRPAGATTCLWPRRRYSCTPPSQDAVQRSYLARLARPGVLSLPNRAQMHMVSARMGAYRFPSHVARARLCMADGDPPVSIQGFVLASSREVSERSAFSHVSMDTASMAKYKSCAALSVGQARSFSCHSTVQVHPTVHCC